jgi:hypothetical protein
LITASFYSPIKLAKVIFCPIHKNSTISHIERFDYLASSAVVVKATEKFRVYRLHAIRKPVTITQAGRNIKNKLFSVFLKYQEVV